jgi:hypothetical protein
MVSHWDRERLLNARAKLSGRSAEEAEEELQQFLGIGSGDLNQAQRIMLLAEDFDYEVLVTAEWLTEQYEVDVRCYRLTLSADGDSEYLSCIGIYPPPEITQHAVRRGRGRNAATQPTQFADWHTALREVDPAVAEFFRQGLAAGQQSYLPKRILSYRIKDKRRFDVSARRRNAYVWQIGRFKNDVEFWSSRISQQDSVQPVADGSNLRFFLHTPADFEQFGQAVQQALRDVEFVEVIDAGGNLSAE